MPFVYIDGGVSWSPDGTKLAFVLGERPTLKGSSDVTSLAVLDLASHRLDRIATLNADSSMTPAWSPDGTRLAVTDPVSELGGLLIFDLTGHVVLHVPDLWTLAPLRGSEWSPDGRTLALIDERTQKTLLFVDSASGKVEASHPFGWDFDAGINLEVFGWREGSPVVNTSRRALVSLSADGKEQQLLSSEFGMSNSIVLARDVLLDGSIRTATPPHGKPQPFHIPLSPATMQWTAVIAGITAVISLAELYDRRRYRDRRSIPRQR
jgi:WD40 repeat protein